VNASTVLGRDVVTVGRLNVEFAGKRKTVHALRDVDLSISKGRILGVVGESGSGKSTLALAIMGLLPPRARVSGSIRVGDRELVGSSEREMRILRGCRLSMIFQDPMTSLNPVRTVGDMMADVQYRAPISRRRKNERSVEALLKVGIPDAVRQLDRYPHQLSGGMRQRVAIAMALLGRPDLLIADEPTTALDVTLEAQILQLLRSLRSEIDGSIMFISHNLGAIAEISDDVAVFYAGEVVERGRVREIFHDPRHPYTRALLDCDPARITETARQLPAIPGDVPSLAEFPTGCVFADRCARVTEACRAARTALRAFAPDRAVRCIHAEIGPS
jgi:oligopeptide/dipeptide ABC transporter ATP-binding protein